VLREPLSCCGPGSHDGYAAQFQEDRSPSSPGNPSRRTRPVSSGLRPDRPLVHVTGRVAWRRWLEREHASSVGVWAVTVRKDALAPDEEYVSAVDLNEECLCFGWIDSKPARIDDRHTALLCTPRKPGSGWSRVNKDRLERLIAEGRVAPAGLAAIERAKLDGSWNKLDHVDLLAVPGDLAQALDRLPPARSNFEAFPRSARRAILEWIGAAKTPATHAKRIEETARLAQEDIRANQWPRPRR
jgi:uncharacterized protein YdeI (YjbR/CyaY-like superfamily)